MLTKRGYFVSELKDFLHVLAPTRPKILIWPFWPWCDQMGQIREFWPGESISLRNFTPVVPKVSLQDFLPTLGAPHSKLPFNLFDSRATKWCFWLVCGPLQNFLPILGAPRPKITIRSFWPSCDQMVLLTSVWPKSVFSFLRCDHVQIFKIFNWRYFGPLRQWCRKFPYQFFYPFWAPHSWKLPFGLFDHCATKWCFWPACDQNLCSVFLTVVRPGMASKSPN